MRIVFTEHAIFKMNLRNIDTPEILEAIYFPDVIEENIHNKTVKKIRKNGQVLVIYYKEEIDVIRIITVFSTSKLKKYLK